MIKELRSILAGAVAALALSCGAAAAAEAMDPATGLRVLPYAVNDVSPRYEHMGDTLIRNVAVIDGLGNKPQKNRDVLVRDGRIAQIARGGSVAAPEGARVIDGEGHTLLPGLIDLHVHFEGLDRFASSLVEDPRLMSDAYRYKTYLYGFLYAGVTTVLDAGAEPNLGVGLKRLIEDDYVMGPRYFWSGPIYEGGVQTSAPGQINNIAAVEHIDGMLDYLQYLQVDFVKLYRRTPVWMMERISKAAHDRGMRVFIDAWERNNFGYMTQVGRVDGYAHLNFHLPITDEDARTLAEHDNFVITTFYALNGFSGRIFEENPDYYDSPLIRDVLPPEYVDLLAAESKTDPLEKVAEAIQHMVITPVQDIMGLEGKARKETMREMSRIGGENTRKLLKAGVLVGAGTDGGQGESMLVELELMVADAGLSPIEAIRIATYNGARILGQEKNFGSIQEGLIADLLMVRGDPSKNIRDLRNTAHVFKEGKIIDRQSLTRQWAY